MVLCPINGIARMRECRNHLQQSGTGPRQPQQASAAENSSQTRSQDHSKNIHCRGASTAEPAMKRCKALTAAREISRRGTGGRPRPGTRARSTHNFKMFCSQPTCNNQDRAYHHSNNRQYKMIHRRISLFLLRVACHLSIYHGAQRLPSEHKHHNH